jgi:hypothetical protein
MQLGLGFWGSKTFLSAVELGVFTELAKWPQDDESLRTCLDLHLRSALRWSNEFFLSLQVVPLSCFALRNPGFRSA